MSKPLNRKLAILNKKFADVLTAETLTEQEKREERRVIKRQRKKVTRRLNDKELKTALEDHEALKTEI